MELVMAAATDCGTVRKVNEDFFFHSKKKRLLIVCDGMGGHQGGATASRIAGETVRDVFMYPDLAELARFCQDVKERLPALALRLVAGARLANRRLRLLAENDREMHGMGTTIAALALSDTLACTVHVGDTRVYHLRSNGIHQLTEDHSWVNELLQDREISEEEVKHFRKKNVLTRALGTHPASKIDVQWFPLPGTSKFLLSSDGLHNALGAEAMLAELRGEDEATLQKSVERLVERAKTANGSDNITAAVVMIKNGRPHATEVTRVALTLPEEPESFFGLEDRFIKIKFSDFDEQSPQSVPANRLRRFAIAAGAGTIALTALGYGWMKFHPSFQNEPNAGVVSSHRSMPQPASVTPSAAGVGASDSISQAPFTQSTPVDTPGWQQKASPAPVEHLATAPRADSQFVAVHDTIPSSFADSSSATVPRLPDQTVNPPLRGEAGHDSVPELPAKATTAGLETDSLEAKPVPAEKKPTEILAAPPASLVPATGGRLFLPGLNQARYEGAEVFANDVRLGPVRELAETGFFLRPGAYTIAIKDSTGRLLHQRKNVTVLKGDVKPLEFLEP